MTARLVDLPAYAKFLVELPGDTMYQTCLALSGAGFDGDLAREVRRPGNAAIAVKLLRERFSLTDDFFRETGEFRVQIPALPRPTLGELKAKFPWIESIERDNSPTETVTLTIGTMLWPGHNEMGGVEYERRLTSISGLVGYQQLVWLVEHQDKHPTFKALFGKLNIQAPGLIIRTTRDSVDGGNVNFPCLGRGGIGWSLSWQRLGYGLNLNHRVARAIPVETP